MLRIKFSRTGLTFQQDEKCLSLSIGPVSHFFLMEAVTPHLLALSRGLARLETRGGEKRREEGVREPGIQSAFNIDSNPISWISIFVIYFLRRQRRHYLHRERGGVFPRVSPDAYRCRVVIDQISKTINKRSSLAMIRSVLDSRRSTASFLIVSDRLPVSEKLFGYSYQLR